MPRIRVRIWVLVYFVCAAVFAVIQVPLSWAFAIISLNLPVSAPDALHFAPAGVVSDAASITASRWQSPAFLMVSAMANPPHPGQLTDSYREYYQKGWTEERLAEICAPWQPEDLHAVLVSSDKWPAVTGAMLNPNGCGIVTCLNRRIACGWPLLAVSGEVAYDPTSKTHREIGFYRGIDHRIPAGMMLPYRPIWANYFVNAILQAALMTIFIFAITSGFASIRRTLRRRAGVCPFCTFDLRGITKGAICPECGLKDPVHSRPNSPHS